MTTRPHFTEPYLKSLPLPPPGERVVHWDGANPGFGIRVSDTGARTFICQKRLDGRPILVTLGRFTGRNFNAMRQKYDETVAKIDKGHHPTQEKRQAIGTSLADIVADYIADKLKGKRRGHDVEFALGATGSVKCGYVSEPPSLSATPTARSPGPPTVPPSSGPSGNHDGIDGPTPYLRNKPVGRITRLDIERRLDEIRLKSGARLLRATRSVPSELA